MTIRAAANKASRAVAQRLGTELDRIQEKCLLRAGTWRPAALYFMRRERWDR